MAGSFRSRAGWLTLAALLAALPACSGPEEGAAARPPSDAWSTYEGAWFTVEYPASFEVAPSLESIDGDGFDSVFFHGVEADVSFYVLAPLWGRVPTDIAVDDALETQVDRRERADGDRTTATTRIRALDGSYVRDVEEIRDPQDGGFRVFAFRYADEQTRRRYASHFRRFQGSLNQFSD